MPESRSLFWQRLCAAAVGLLVMGAAVAAATMGRTAELSMLRLAVVAGAISAGLSGLGLAVAPRRVWDRGLSALKNWLAGWQQASIQRDMACGPGLVAIAALTFVCLVIIEFPRESDPTRDDQGVYLELGREIEASGGLPSLVRGLYSGDFAESNRHPLYLALITPGGTPGRFVRAKIISAVWGGAAVVGMGLLVCRRWGGCVGGWLAILLATNQALLFESTRAVCDALLVTWGGLIWLIASEIEQRWLLTRHGLADAATPWHKKALGLGMLIGAAWLTKGTAMLFLPTVAIWTTWMACTRWSQRRPEHQPREPILRPWLSTGLVLGIGFLLIAHPLLIRNQVRFGSAFYNINSYLMYVDEYFDPETLESQMSLTEARQQYLSTHSVTDIAKREVSGLIWEALILLRTLGPSPLQDGRLVIGIALAGLAILGGTQSGSGTRFVLLSTLLVWAVMAWYVPIAAGDRFVMLLTVPHLALAVIGGVRLLSLLTPRHYTNPTAHYLAAAIWCLGIIVATSQ